MKVSLLLGKTGKKTPRKINGWKLKTHPIEKEHHLNQSIIFRFELLIFQGVKL